MGYRLIRVGADSRAVVIASERVVLLLCLGEFVPTAIVWFPVTVSMHFTDFIPSINADIVSLF